MNYDITFCCKKDCKDKECLRNINNYKTFENRNISIAMFKDCEHWKEVQDD